MPQEIRFKNGSVWVKAVQIHVFNETSGKYDQGRYFISFSFSRPSTVFFGETVKDEHSYPMLWDSESAALDYAKIFFEHILM